MSSTQADHDEGSVQSITTGGTSPMVAPSGIQETTFGRRTMSMPQETALLGKPSILLNALEPLKGVRRRKPSFVPGQHTRV